MIVEIQLAGLRARLGERHIEMELNGYCADPAGS